MKMRILWTGLVLISLGLPNFSNLKAEELKMVQLTNQLRVQLGLVPLQQDDRLQDAAKKHSQQLNQIGKLTHQGMDADGMTPMQRMMRAGVTEAVLYGENIACGDESAKGTFSLWVHSAGHLANLLNPDFNRIGISRLGHASDRRGCPYYWTMNLAAVNPAESTATSLDPAVLIQSLKEILGFRLDETKIVVPNYLQLPL
jgi:uncharacterized protein YkwD